jgi:chemotaxis signal transduction protein
MRVIEFESSNHRFALPLGCVQRVVASAQPAPLPGAPAIVLGVLNVAGQMLTVIDFGRRIGAAPGPILPSQQLLIVELSGFAVGLMVDAILGVAERAGLGAPALPAKIGAAGFVDSFARLDDGLCMILDPERFLFDEEQAALLAALDKAVHEYS